MPCLRKTWLWAAFCAATIASFTCTAGAAESAFPTKPIRLIVASSPGGPNDLLARTVSTPGVRQWPTHRGRQRAGAEA